jgi:multiple sugar transport system permease protein
MTASADDMAGNKGTLTARRAGRSAAGAACLLLLPFLCVFILFFLAPALQTWTMSLTESSLTRTNAYIGLANYAALLRDPAFHESLRHTCYFAALTVVPLAAIGLLMALLVDHFQRGQGVLQAAFFLPAVLPISVMTLIVGWVLHPGFGLVNHILGGERAWLADVDWAMPAIALGTIWWTAGFNMLMFLAALRNIPAELYEAAAIDGASRWQVFRDITWPALLPATGMALVLQLIASFKVFGQTYILTSGGPFNTTRVTLHYMYETAFIQSDAGYAAAIAMAFVVIVSSLVGMQMALLKWFRRDE